MSDVDDLRAAFAAWSLVRPSQEALSIVDLSRAAAQLAGAPNAQPTPGSRALADLIGPCEHLILIIVDGLGKRLIEALPRESFLATHLVAELTTVFPSTTATALTTFATGEWPNTHAVTGWWTHIDEIGGAAVILQFARRSDGRSLLDLDVTAKKAFPAPALASSFARDTLVLLPERIAHSVYSDYISGGRARLGYRSFPRALEALGERVLRATAPTYTYLYTYRLDTAVHAHGTGHREVRTVLVELDRQLARLRQMLGGRGRIVVSADHGFLDTPRRSRHRIVPSDPLAGTLRFPPSGDARVLYLHVQDGAIADARQVFHEQLGERFILITAEEAEVMELFGPGPLTAAASGRIGDLVAISRGADVVEYQPSGGVGKIVSQASHHSGLTPEEMVVPLVVA